MTRAGKWLPERSGVYRAPDDAGALRNAGAPLGFAWLEVDIGTVRDKSALMHTFARGLAFPSGFGANWDALADNLQDLAWCPAAGYVLHLRHGEAARQALGPQWHTFMQVLQASARYWSSRGRPFIALVEGGEELPAWT